jgi:asparagine synthase (glutamine-hydrolysing)
LDRNALEQEGLLDANAVRKMWEEHISGEHNWQHGIWNILMFQAWLAESNAMFSEP